ncbi:MAG: o-succinylbenzoate synthase, partial [Kaistella sp.]
FTKNPKIPQGLGTGGLFTNNLETRLELSGDLLSIKKV